MDEREAYASRLRLVLERLAATLEEVPATRLDESPLPEGTNSPAMIAAHVLGAVRGWALGMGAGVDVERDRAAEFATRGESAEALAARLRALADEVDRTLEDLGPDRLGEVVTPPQALFGALEARPIARREALVSAVQHASEHLGELQLIRDLYRTG
ncbi:MAG: DUF664 domain-containing protein [Dehalococcoidia bacterium]|nr:DUF664 domain-containing protein [Dehalococcoidia bacterium]